MKVYQVNQLLPNQIRGAHACALKRKARAAGTHPRYIGMLLRNIPHIIYGLEGLEALKPLLVTYFIRAFSPYKVYAQGEVSITSP